MKKMLFFFDKIIIINNNKLNIHKEVHEKCYKMLIIVIKNIIIRLNN